MRAVPFIYRFTTQVNNEELVPPLWFVGNKYTVVISYLGMCAAMGELILRSSQIKKKILVVFVILTYVIIISSYMYHFIEIAQTATSTYHEQTQCKVNIFA